MKTQRKIKRAILYARVATTEVLKKSGSLTYQIDEQKLYCKKHNIQVEGIFYDLASGVSFDREEFQNLLNDLRSKKIEADLLLISSWDRFSRNKSETEIMVKKINSLGVKVKALKGDVNDLLIKQVITKFKNKK